MCHLKRFRTGKMHCSHMLNLPRRRHKTINRVRQPPAVSQGMKTMRANREEFLRYGINRRLKKSRQARQTYFFKRAEPFAGCMDDIGLASRRQEGERRPDRSAADVKNKNRGFTGSFLG